MAEAASPDPLTARPPARPRHGWPLVLYAATWLTTYLIGGATFALAIMTILTLHELGHYQLARRHRVPATMPFFVPMPLPPFGTMGAVIGMRSRTARPRALFDIAVSGPLAGLLPALGFAALGLKWSEVNWVGEAARHSVELGQPLARWLTSLRLEGLADAAAQTVFFGEPLLFELLSYGVLGPLEPGYAIDLHPVAWAGWVGLFITSVNLLPIGQLDGGHILYTLIPRTAHRISWLALASGCVALFVGQLWQWGLLILVLLRLGIRHPVAALGEPLDRWRVVLGWIILPLAIAGLTPNPIAYR